MKYNSESKISFNLQQQNVCRLLTTQHNSFLYTVSRLVSSRDIRRRGSEEEGGRLLHVTDPDPTIKQKQFPKPPILRTLLHIHAITFLVILTFSWIDTLPGIGRVSSIHNQSSISLHERKKKCLFNFSNLISKL